MANINKKARTAIDLKYEPDGFTLKAYMKSDKFVRCIRGPVGSGKSVASCWEMFRRALAQEPDANGKRRTRWVVIRNTYPELKTTTIKTWLDWFPEETFGKMGWTVPYTHHLKFNDIDMEVIFLAMDREDHVKKLLSLELTGVFINEAREVNKAVVDAATSRVGRFPSMKDGGPTWYGVLMDTNAPEEDHWWPIMAGEVEPPDYMSAEDKLSLVTPDDWEFFTQPAGMFRLKDQDGLTTGYRLNANRENGKWTDKQYYKRIISGKSGRWIAVYVLNELGSERNGISVFNNFNRAIHVSKTPLLFQPDAPLELGLDFGLTGAICLGQRMANGRWLVLREYHANGRGTKRFGSWLKSELPRLQNKMGMKTREVHITGDPAGEQRAQTDETTPFQIMRGLGFSILPSPTNDVSMRLETVDDVFGRLIDGASAILIDPSCTLLIAGFDGKYQYDLDKNTGEQKDTPKKDKWSHVQDGCQYLLLGGGEGNKLLNRKQHTKVYSAETNFDPYERRSFGSRRLKTVRGFGGNRKSR